MHRSALAGIFSVEVKVCVCGMHIGTSGSVLGGSTVPGSQAASAKSQTYVRG